MLLACRCHRNRQGAEILKMTTDRPDLAIVRPSPLLLSQFGAMRREPTRPEAFRFAGFNDAFDHDTLAYDAFRLPDGRVALSGPPLFNLTPLVETMRVMALPNGQQCEASIMQMDRHTRILVNAPADADALRIEIAGGSVDVVISPSQNHVFEGRRVLFTLSKNNHLHWIGDWVRYARDVHGADAVLFYDNGSTLYGAQELLDLFAGIEGIAAARVVEWPYRYGPQGLDATRFWDSDFCQRGAWEHARWYFLQDARSAQNADVDELVVSRSGESVFAAAEADPFGVVRYRGRWVVGTGQAGDAPRDDVRTHRDYQTVLREQRGWRFGILPVDSAGCAAKWTLVPRRCPPSAQWGVHSISGWLPSRRISRDFSYRHFREINDNWKYDRDDRDAFDPDTHEKDDLLAAHYARAGW